jgi:hypothetical protein
MTAFCHNYPDLCFENKYIMGNLYDTRQPNLFPKIPPLKPAEPLDDAKKKILEETFGEQGKIVRTNFRPQRIKPSLESVPDDAIQKASLIEASSLYDKYGFKKAQEFLDNRGIELTIDPQLSTGQGLVVISPEGEVSIAYRGTDVKNGKDILTDVLGFAGKEKNSPEYREVKTQLEKVTENLGKPVELIGFSRGSALSMNLGNEYGINTTQFNPFITKQLVSSQADYPDTFHKIYRTTGDPVSFYASQANNEVGTWDIQSILPKQDTLNPIGEHYLSQFLDNDTARRSSIEALLHRNISHQGKRFDELKQVQEIQDSIAEGLSFSEHISRVSRADYNSETGEFSARTTINTAPVELWLEQGGELTDAETSSLSKNAQFKGRTETKNRYATTEDERLAFAENTPEQQETILGKQQEQVFNAGETLNRYAEEPDVVRNALLGETTVGGTSPELSAEIVKNAHLTNLGVGFIGGIAGSEEAQGIRKGVQSVTGVDIGEDATQAVGGALGATNTAIATSLLSGTELTAAALAPEVLAGAGGAVLGYESQQIIADQLRKAGANEDTVQSVSDIAGGAIGGFTTAGISGLASIGAAALTGGEIGTAFAPETFGASIAIGTAIGATVGAVGYLGGKAEEAGSALIDEIKHPAYNPYYVPPYFQTDPSRTMEYLQQKDYLEALRQQDIAAGITPEQRGNLGIPPPTSATPTPAPAQAQAPAPAQESILGAVEEGLEDVGNWISNLFSP